MTLKFVTKEYTYERFFSDTVEMMTTLRALKERSTKGAYDYTITKPLTKENT